MQALARSTCRQPDQPGRARRQGRAPPSMIKEHNLRVRSRRNRSANHPAGRPAAAQKVPKMPSAMPTDLFELP